MNIVQTTTRYLNEITSDSFHRYRSWDICYQSFCVSERNKTNHYELALGLAFYLASWGMYRGSSGLLQKNHLIHEGVVDILISNEVKALRCEEGNDVTRNNIRDILNLKERLAEHYRSVYFKKGADDSKPISPTDTLLSKILLGALGCAPAYDRYFIYGLKEMNMKNTTFKDASLNELFDFIEDNISDIADAQKLVFTKTEHHYPVMKIVDMYFWQIGYDKELQEQQQRIERQL